MSTGIRSFNNGLILESVSTLSLTGVAGQLQTKTSDNKLYLHNGTIYSPVVTEAHPAPLSNKSISNSTLDMATNKITNVGAPTLATDAATKAYADGLTGVGQNNTASNVGTGVGLFKQKTIYDLEFKTLIAGAGITITPTGADELTIATSITSGANNALSNLSSVAVNENLICGSGLTGPFILGTPTTAASGVFSIDVLIKSGNTSAFSLGSGPINIGSGDSLGTTYGFGNSGNVNLFSGTTAATGSTSGIVNLYSGSTTGAAAGSGIVNIYSGTPSGINSPSGDVNIYSGTPGSGNGYSGNLNIFTGINSGTTIGGILSIYTGNGTAPGGSSAPININTGNGSTTSGNVTIQTGTATTRGSITLNAKVVNITSADGLDMGSKKITSVLDPASNQDAATKKYVDDTVVNTLPAGVISPYAGTSAPASWLLCFGQSIDTTTYATLFAVIGYTYGGAGANFNIPDLRGRAIAGKDNMGGTSANRLTNTYTGGINGDILGNTGGEEAHQLSEAELAAHTHTTRTANGATSGPLNLNVLLATVNSQDTAVGNSTGGDTPHNNVQPTFILNYIIKT